MAKRKRAARDSPKLGYGFNDVLKLTAATRSNLIHWTNIGIITPDLENTGGIGHPRRFSPQNLIEAEIGAALNAFRVPAETIRGGLNVFRLFHRDMLRFEGEMHESGGKVLTKSVAVFLRHKLGVSAPDDEVLQGAEYAKRLVYAWRRIRRGPLSRGEPDPMTGLQFLGLFVSGTYGDRDITFATVELDPPNLRSVIEGSAIVIDLANLVFRVGERFKRLGMAIGEW